MFLASFKKNVYFIMAGKHNQLDKVKTINGCFQLLVYMFYIFGVEYVPLSISIISFKCRETTA